MPTFKVNMLNDQEAEHSKSLMLYQRQEKLPTDLQTLAWRALPDLAKPAEPLTYDITLDFQVSTGGGSAGGGGPVGGVPSLQGWALEPFSLVAPPGAGFAPSAPVDVQWAAPGLPAPNTGAGSGYEPGACLRGTPAALVGQPCSLEPFSRAPGEAGAVAGDCGEFAQVE